MDEHQQFVLFAREHVGLGWSAEQTANLANVLLVFRVKVKLSFVNARKL
jgi:hypothetical protein